MTDNLDQKPVKPSVFAQAVRLFATPLQRAVERETVPGNATLVILAILAVIGLAVQALNLWERIAG
jgi:hypothetical protein